MQEELKSQLSVRLSERDKRRRIEEEKKVVKELVTLIAKDDYASVVSKTCE